MKTYRIELLNREHSSIEVAEDQYILEAVEKAGLLFGSAVQRQSFLA